MTAPRGFAVDPRRVVHETIDGETILIALETGVYYSLSGSGPEVWDLVLAGLPGVTVDGEPRDGRMVVLLAPPATPGSTNAALVRGGVEVSELVAEHERLEDVFMELVGDDTDDNSAER
jgi:hypothetical protein